MLPQFYSFRDVCSALKISPNTLRARIVKGEITGRKVGGQWRFTETDLADIASRCDGPDVSPSIIPIVSARSKTDRKPQPSRSSFRERMKAKGYI